MRNLDFQFSRRSNSISCGHHPSETTFRRGSGFGGNQWKEPLFASDIETITAQNIINQFAKNPEYRILFPDVPPTKLNRIGPLSDFNFFRKELKRIFPILYGIEYFR